ncbi:MAG: hypothetical protein Q8L78_06100 [Coxiellaceae bacterium]|nr:hypothetical protein [Coxiellaceae bacterium]
MHPETKQRWNTPEFHAEMKAVTSDYQNYGGYQLGDNNAGIAANIFHPDFSNQLELLVEVIKGKCPTNYTRASSLKF